MPPWLKYQLHPDMEDWCDFPFEMVEALTTIRRGFRESQVCFALCVQLPPREAEHLVNLESPRIVSMVYYFTSTAIDPPAFIYVGKDKVESKSQRRKSRTLN